VIRDAQPRDFAAILALNEESVRFTSSLDAAALADLHAQAAYHRVVEEEGRVAAFLLAVAPGQPYESLNYTWFAARYDDFLYIDRVVVACDRRHAGLGAALYDDVAAWATANGFRRLVCEVNVEPPNEVSGAFHARQGFAQVGTQWVAGGTKRVALLERVLGRRDERHDSGSGRPARLEDLPWVGPAVAAKLRAVGVLEPPDLIGRDPYSLYGELNARTGRRHDPCLLDVFIASTRFMSGEPARPWWEYTAERKARLAGGAPTEKPGGRARRDAAPTAARDAARTAARAYDDEAEAVGWHGPEVVFGLAFQYVRPGEAILDLGIGTGLASELFRKAGLRPCGVDVDEDMLSACRAKGFTDLARHDLTTVPYPFEVASFDHAVCVGVLNFIADPAPVVAEVARVMRPGGMFAFAVGDRREGDAPHYLVRDDSSGRAESVSMYRHGEDEVAAWLRASGLTLLRQLTFVVPMDRERTRCIQARAYVARKDARDRHSS
jgi:predicted GNAT superfamily acetyltransferase/SAM-dependent methyltransferase